MNQKIKYRFEFRRDVTKTVPVDPPARGHRTERIGTQGITVEMEIDPDKVFANAFAHKFVRGAKQSKSENGAIKAYIIRTDEPRLD